MSGNYKTNFRRYKRNLRWKAGQRKKGESTKVANEDYNAYDWGESYCPHCHEPMGFNRQTKQWVCSACGQSFPDDWWHQVTEPEANQYLTQHPDPWMDSEPGTLTLPEHWGTWQPEGWDQELFSPSGHRCPMCKSHRLIENGNSLLCSDCGWAGEKLNLSEDEMPPPSQ